MVKHILVFRFSAMGDVAMTVPVLNALTQHHPTLKITVVTRPFFKPLFSTLTNVEVFPVDFKNEYKGVLGLYKLSKQLKALHVDAIADLHNVLRTKILKYFLGGKPYIQINKGRKEKKALVTGKVFKQLKTTHQRYADVFAQLGFPVDISKPDFPQKITLNQNLKSFISNPELQTIGIAPFAAFKGKMYPIMQMKKVIESLSENHNIILFGGGKQEIEQLNSIEAKFQNTTSVAGKLNLEEELALMSNFDLMLAMDSGNAHIAAMFGVKVITIWGVTHPYAGFTPFNQPTDYSLLADRDQFPLIPTSVYGKKYPKDYENAAGSISVEQILQKITSII